MSNTEPLVLEFKIVGKSDLSSVGNLSFKLKGFQAKLYDALEANKGITVEKMAAPEGSRLQTKSLTFEAVRVVIENPDMVKELISIDNLADAAQLSALGEHFVEFAAELGKHALFGLVIERALHPAIKHTVSAVKHAGASIKDAVTGASDDGNVPPPDAVRSDVPV